MDPQVGGGGKRLKKDAKSTSTTLKTSATKSTLATPATTPTTGATKSTPTTATATATTKNTPKTTAKTAKPAKKKAISEQGYDPEEGPPGRSLFITIGIWFLVIILIAGGVMFGLILTQSEIDDTPKKILQQHKEDTVKSIDKAIQVVQTFPDLFDDFALEQMSPELFKIIRKELNVEDLKELDFYKESAIPQYASVYVTLETTCPRLPTGFNVENFLSLWKNGTIMQREQLKKIISPIIAYETSFNATLKSESEKPGRFSKNRIVVYSEDIVKMLHDYKEITVARYDALIESYEDQVASRNFADFAHLLFDIISYSIGLIIVGAIIIVFILFQKGKIKLKTLNKSSMILFIISLVFALGLMVYSVLGAAGLSPFGYECKLSSNVQNPDKKFTNSDEQITDLGKIAGSCENGASIFSKTTPHLNFDAIKRSLDGFEMDVITFAANLQFKGDLSGEEIIDMKSALDKESLRLKKYRDKPTCLASESKNMIISMIGALENIKTGLETLETRANELENKNVQPILSAHIKTSFDTLRNVSDAAVDSMNSQLDLVDISCEEVVTSACNDRMFHLLKINISGWILFFVFALVALLAKLLYTIPAKEFEQYHEFEEELKSMKEEVETATKAADEANDDLAKAQEKHDKYKKKVEEELEVTRSELEKLRNVLVLEEKKRISLEKALTKTSKEKKAAVKREKDLEKSLSTLTKKAKKSKKNQKDEPSTSQPKNGEDQNGGDGTDTLAVRF
ncbi:unnamed protein product [Caenorhabditis angaria]|uniref:Uncharacterized protein n=1 Tax=Caenorhabditis angaria TaxID=860376 RepID=A0A9P1MX01_9PELO|nr:unnamed protein product [Caenorhabditis angaria]